ncbi:hypothetical protein [Solibacillus cecembensis]|uniref:hypothetical protein n=1 Tax=Solibacillus cecembensis TaxID=459347 RepID=UPI003D00A64F
MNQLNIFHVIGLNTDPVYNSICKIPNNSEIQIDHNVIRKTEKYFEVENDDEHLLFRTLEECYQFVSGIVIYPSKKANGCTR